METFQLRFAVSNQESWNKLDGDFNMQDFYWNVVGIFEDSGEFGAELLAWWSRYASKILASFQFGYSSIQWICTGRSLALEKMEKRERKIRQKNPH